MLASEVLGWGFQKGGGWEKEFFRGAWHSMKWGKQTLLANDACLDGRGFGRVCTLWMGMGMGMGEG